MSTFLFPLGVVLFYFIGELFLDNLGQKHTVNKIKVAKAKKKKQVLWFYDHDKLTTFI